MKKTARSCPECRGLGFVVSCTSGSMFCPDGSLQVQKCDTCGVLPYDDEAKEVAAAVLDRLLSPAQTAGREATALSVAKFWRSRVIASWKKYWDERFEVDAIIEGDPGGGRHFWVGEVDDTLDSTSTRCCRGSHLSEKKALACARKRKKELVEGR